MVIPLSEARISVYPSGVDLATSAAAMLPFAPGRFSITTDHPSVSCKYWASSRAEISGAPPGGMVTSTLIGRDGKGAWASAAALPKKAANARTTALIAFVFMRSPFPPVQGQAFVTARRD